MGKLIWDMEQGSQEWHDLRRKSIGSSDAAVIMGCSPWKNIIQLWKEKIGVEENGATTSYMRRGKDLEEDARILFQALQGCDDLNSFIYQHDTYPWMIASLDGITIDGKTLVEIKCPGTEDHQKAKKGLVPEKYIPQLQHQLEVCGLDNMFYLSYQSPIDFAIIEIKRDQKYIDELIEKEKMFWNCVETVTPPFDGYQDFSVNQEWLQAEYDYAEAYKECQVHEERKERAKKRLIELSLGGNTKGQSLKLTRVFKKGRIDYEQIDALKDLDLERFRSRGTESVRIDWL